MDQLPTSDFLQVVFSPYLLREARGIKVEAVLQTTEHHYLLLARAVVVNNVVLKLEQMQT